MTRRQAIIVSCPKCGRPRLYGHACGYCGDPEPEAALTALYGHLWGCTGYVSRNTEGEAP
jgi:ribosomal protein L32